MKMRAHGTTPGRCAFCGGGGLTKEHFWSAWLSDLVQHPSDRGPYIEDFIVRIGKPSRLVQRRLKERQGHVVTKKIRAVCGRCNNGWMSGVETAVRPIVEPMLLGREIVLTREMQRRLAQWIALKVMVGEQNQRHNEKEEIVVPRSDRMKFCESRDIPPYFNIWIARYVAFGDWRHAYLRHSVLVSGTNPPTFAEDTGGKNTQVTAMGVGELFIFCALCRAPGVEITDHIRVSEPFVRLWPSQKEEIRWPLPQAIDDRAATAAAGVLKTLMDSPFTGYGGETLDGH